MQRSLNSDRQTQESQDDSSVAADSRVGHVYAAIRERAESFGFKPEAQINEVALAKSLGTSRTPVREALNQLVAEGFLTFQSRKGFFCRALGPAQILALYEARIAVECEAARLAVRKSADEDLVRILEKLRAMEPEYDSCADPDRLLELDEEFHNQITLLSGNPELMRMLANLNGRIRFLRRIDLRNMSKARLESHTHSSAHREILAGLERRDEFAVVDAMRKHIERRREELTEVVTSAFAEIYFGDELA